MIETRKVALLGAVLATLLTFYASIHAGASLNGISYIPTVLAGIIATILFLVLAVKAWGQEPPGEMVAWIFGHLTIWSAAFTIEEAGWWFWRMYRDSELSIVFAEQLTPGLKAVQGAAILGLLAFAWMSKKQITGNKLSSYLRLTWMGSMLISTIGFLLVGVFFG